MRLQPGVTTSQTTTRREAAQDLDVANLDSDPAPLRGASFSRDPCTPG